MKNDLKILSWNVNGLRAAAKKGLRDWILEQNPDILCLQETKAQKEQLPGEIREIPGYHSFFASAQRPGYSGVAIYSKKEPQRVQIGFGVDDFDREGRVLIADYEDFSLLNCYFPNGSASPERLAYKMAFYEFLLTYLQDRQSTIVCGDVNTAHTELDLARPKENEKVSGFLPQERDWIDRFLQSGYVDTFRMYHTEGEQYTWWDMKTRARSRNVGWRLDYFFAPEALKKRIKDAFILSEVLGSDHCPIGILLQAEAGQESK